MLLRLPASLHYPITVTELLKQPNDDVARFAPLFSYIYKTSVIEGDELGNERRVDKTFPTRFESSVEGTLVQWKITKGAVIAHFDMAVAEIEEPCSHSLQFAGMCANCGKDMTESSYITEQLDTTRATINMDHNNIALKVSQDEAKKVEDEAKRRLLKQKKLSLVVDLDQTIIHATVDPTVSEWQQDESNPNHEAVKDVQAFLLKDDGPGNRGCWYYIKLRPGLSDFLENVLKMYELHIYTMGTRQYARNIANLIDPQHKIFGDRILSRDESGSMTAKNLQRLFPVDTKMVVIIDDRGDVWKWSPNLIKVTPYDFFVGIGDINSSFLPKKPSPKPSARITALTIPSPKEKRIEDTAPERVSNGGEATQQDAMFAKEQDPLVVDSDASPFEHVVAMGVNDDSTKRKVQTNEQDRAIAAQLDERPLRKQQKQLEADDAAAETSSSNKANDDSESSPVESIDPDRPRHNLLQDHDRELYHLEESLRTVHAAFFDAYAQQVATTQGGRLGQLRGVHKWKSASEKSDLDLVPDIKAILPAVKSRVLGGVCIVFSGIVPLGVDTGTTDLAILAISFGARIDDDMGKYTTHLVAARNRTAKVRKALRRGKGRIKVVSPHWLYDSISSWRKLDEEHYLLDVEESKNGAVDDEDLLSESESPNASESDGSESGANDLMRTQIQKPSLKISIKPRGGLIDEDGSDLEGVAPSQDDIDDHSPVGGSNEDWSAMNDELADFLGSEAEESDVDSVASNGSEVSSILSLRGQKRSRHDQESGSEGDGYRKSNKKQAIGGTTHSLSQTTMADDDNFESREDMADEVKIAKTSCDDEEAKEGEGWSDFGEEDLEAELEKAASEDRDEG